MVSMNDAIKQDTVERLVPIGDFKGVFEFEGEKHYVTYDNEKVVLHDPGLESVFTELLTCPTLSQLVEAIIKAGLDPEQVLQIFEDKGIMIWASDDKLLHAHLRIDVTPVGGSAPESHVSNYLTTKGVLVTLSDVTVAAGLAGNADVNLLEALEAIAAETGDSVEAVSLTVLKELPLLLASKAGFLRLPS